MVQLVRIQLFLSQHQRIYISMESANLVVGGYNGLLKIRDRETMKQVVSILETEFPDLKDNPVEFYNCQELYQWSSKRSELYILSFRHDHSDYHNYDDGYFLEFCLNVPHVI